MPYYLDIYIFFKKNYSHLSLNLILWLAWAPSMKAINYIKFVDKQTDDNSVIEQA